MWMTNYIDAIKRKLIDEYGFPENPDKPGCVLGDVPDSSYVMTIEGKVVDVKIKDGLISLFVRDQVSNSTKE
jgi:hypothetical protein